jgi:chromosome partitioning protein
MASIIVIAGDKGGCGKTTTSHAICHGLAMYGIHAYHIPTDRRREIRPASSNRHCWRIPRASLQCGNGSC